VEKLSQRQVILLLSLNRIAIVLLWFKFSNQDVWVVQILALVYLAILSAPLLFLSKQFAQLTVIEYLPILLGKLIGKVLGTLYAVFFIFIAIVDLSLFDNIIKPINFPETPDYAIIALALLTCTYGIYKGLEVICRASEILTPLVLVIIVFYAILQIPDMNFKELLPILADSSFAEINFEAFKTAAQINEIVTFVMLVPVLDKKGKISTTFAWVALIIILFSLIIIVPTLAGLGINLPQKTFDPYYLFIKQINIYDFITRIEFLIVAAWNIGMFLKISILLYLATICLVQVFGFTKRKVLIIPMIAMIFLIVLKTDILTSYVVFSIIENYVPYINLIFMFGIPAIALALFFLKKVIMKKADFTKA
jgi:spore germination protein (amino acid permease)